MSDFHMKKIIGFFACLCVCGCDQNSHQATSSASGKETAAKTDSLVEVKPKETKPVVVADALQISKSGVMRINSTIQTYLQLQPWEKSSPLRRLALGCIVAEKRVLTTAQQVADATYIEFANADNTKRATAKVLAIDYNRNLALLGLEDEKNAELFENTKPVAVDGALKRGDKLSCIQLGEDGVSIISDGEIQAVNMYSSLLPDSPMLNYLCKVPLQRSSNSFTLPLVSEGKLAGMLSSYDAQDQQCNVIAAPVISQFLTDANTGNYRGSASLAIELVDSSDPVWRQQLGLNKSGGCYVQNVQPGSAAAAAGVQKGDVLHAIDSHEIDAKGFYQDSDYGRMFWSNLLMDKKAGEKITLQLWRGGKPLELEVELEPAGSASKLIAEHSFGKAPNFIIHGGLVFQEVSRAWLEAFGKDWQNRAPVHLVAALDEQHELLKNGKKSLLIISNVIPTPLTLGYERLGGRVVTKVQDREVSNLSELAAALDAQQGIFTIELEQAPYKIYMDKNTSEIINKRMLESGFEKLRRLDNK